MKRRTIASDTSPQQATASLAAALAALRTARDVAEFLSDLCTPAEIEALSDRWRVVPLLLEGIPYRDIHDRTGVSVTTIGRVARCLSEGHGYRHAARELGLQATGPHDEVPAHAS